MQGKKHYAPKLFNSFRLSERVPEDNFYRRLKEAIDLRWLYKATKKYYGTEGQVSIDPVVFFRFMLVGYLENIISDREIIKTAALRLDMLYYVGYDIDETLPWHSTLSRTRKLYGEEVFKQLFKQVLKQCIDKGMVAGKRQSIDSVLVKANASMDSVVAKEILEDAEKYASELKEEDALPQQQEDDQKKAVLAKPTDLKVCDKKEKTGETKDKNEQQKRLSNTTHYSPVDPDARISTKTNKPVQLNYLGQVSVDAAHHVITNIESHHADKRDSECLVAAVIHTSNNLKETGNLKVEEVLCDGNYGSGESLQYLEQENITGYIPNPGSYKAEREGFVYHKEEDYYTCSQGKVLSYKNTYADRDGYLKKEYRSERKDCRDCPLKEKCLGEKGREKKINDTVDKAYYDRMHIRMQTPKGRSMRKVRQSTVEPVIGTLVNYTGMRKISSRGIEQASKCMMMAAVAYNLKKMMKWTSKKINAAVKEIETTIENCYKSLFVLMNAHIVQYNKKIIFKKSWNYYWYSMPQCITGSSEI
jgi:transposase